MGRDAAPRRPSELILRSPRPDTDPAFAELAERIAPVVAPVPVRVCHGDGSADEAPLPGAALVADGRPETRALLAAAPSFGRWSWIHLTSSGPDPLETWTEEKEPALSGAPLLTYSRGVNARSMAEWVVGALLHFHRDFGHYLEAAREGRWERRWARELSGQTLVVVGSGSAGSETARLAGALGMRTVGISRSGRVLPGFERVVPAAAAGEVWGEGDATVVLLPLTPETRGSIGETAVRRLKSGSLLLVASRGGIVDEHAVVRALRRGQLAGAAFDVFEQEPLPPDHPLRRESRVLVTPHVAGTTDRFMERTAEILSDIWRAWQGEGSSEALERYRFRPRAEADRTSLDLEALLP